MRLSLYHLVLMAIAISFVSATASFLAWNHANNQRDAGRLLVAQADYDLCHSLYSNVVSTDNDALKHATVAYYTRLLPFLTAQQAANLAAEQKAALLRQKEKFDPKQCSSLPTQKLAH